jgi:uncharacterized protein (TIGR00369 family)
VSPTAPDPLASLRTANSSAAFNRWAGFEVVEAAPGRAVLRLQWREELGQYAGHLHAGIVAALIDTACGFAAGTLAGAVVATHCAVTFVAPGTGPVFLASADTVKAGRRQVFARAELHQERDGDRTLIAYGETMLVPLGQPVMPRG